MRYHNITHDDMLNGDGLRVVLWVAGCDHCCKGCQNPSTWDPEGGLAFDDPDIAVEWPIPEGMELNLSDKDRKWGSFKEYTEKYHK